MDGHKDVTTTCMVTTRTLAVSHIWGTNHMVMLGYDWGFLSSSYTYQIHFIHIKEVWHTYMMWMVIRTPPHCMAIARAQLCCMSHLGTNYTVRMWLGPPIHFIHMSGKHHTYKRCLKYFICCGWSYGCHPSLYGPGFRLLCVTLTLGTNFWGQLWSCKIVQTQMLGLLGWCSGALRFPGHAWVGRGRQWMTTRTTYDNEDNKRGRRMMD